MGKYEIDMGDVRCKPVSTGSIGKMKHGSLWDMMLDNRTCERHREPFLEGQRSVNIELNVPAPPRGIGPRKTKYPFNNLPVGASLFAEGRAGYQLRSAAFAWAARTEGKIVTSKAENGGVRIWRIA
jgi:hypothetical protein